MKERKTKRVDVRISNDDLRILNILKKRLGKSTYAIAKEAIHSYYFSVIKQAEYEEDFFKNYKKG